jgi:agmatinase
MHLLTCPLVSIVGCALFVSAHEALYQSVLDAGHHSQVPIDDSQIDITTGTQFNGLMTFANLPYVNCFVDSEAENARYDIAVLGAPFDTVCVFLRSFL